jgi:ABC-type branched-subunit amino acid transport system substrate-binding protein
METSISLSAAVAAYGRKARGPWCSLAVFAATLSVFIPACLSSGTTGAPDNAIRIGAILPFSGHSSSMGVPLESALRLAIDAVNAAGGLDGRPLYLEVGDSGSDVTIGLTNALALISANPMPFFIGPEEPDVAPQLVPTVAANQMAELMPGLMSLPIHNTDLDGEWFKLTPSVNYLACAIAKRMLDDGVVTASTVTDADAYSVRFASAFAQIFTALGGQSVRSLQIPTKSADLSAILRGAGETSVLITSPATATELLQQQIVKGQTMKWYLGPTLNNPEVLRNLPEGALEGTTGFSPDFGSQAAAFDSYFGLATSSTPLPGAHYYYDAVALLALAVAEALAQEGAIPGPAALKSHLIHVASDGGEVIAFDQIAKGLALVKSGAKVQYQGAAGTNPLDDLGDSTQSQVAIWQITSTTFEIVAHQQCSAAEAYPDTTSP